MCRSVAAVCMPHRLCACIVFTVHTVQYSQDLTQGLFGDVTEASRLGVVYTVYCTMYIEQYTVAQVRARKGLKIKALELTMTQPSPSFEKYTRGYLLKPQSPDLSRFQVNYLLV